MKKLIYKLNSTPLWLALHTELRLRQVAYSDVNGTQECITTVLTSFLSQDDEAAREAAAAGEKEAARSLMLKLSAVPVTSMDPVTSRCHFLCHSTTGDSFYLCGKGRATIYPGKWQSVTESLHLVRMG